MTLLPADRTSKHIADSSEVDLCTVTHHSCGAAAGTTVQTLFAAFSVLQAPETPSLWHAYLFLYTDLENRSSRSA